MARHGVGVLHGVLRSAKRELEADGYSVVQAHSDAAWDLIAVKEVSTEPVRCIRLKRTTSERGAKQLLSRFFPTMESGFQPYRQEIWIWIDRQGWAKK